MPPGGQIWAVRGLRGFPNQGEGGERLRRGVCSPRDRAGGEGGGKVEGKQGCSVYGARLWRGWASRASPESCPEEAEGPWLLM